MAHICFARLYVVYQTHRNIYAPSRRRREFLSGVAMEPVSGLLPDPPRRRLSGTGTAPWPPGLRPRRLPDVKPPCQTRPEPSGSGRFFLYGGTPGAQQAHFRRFWRRAPAQPSHRRAGLGGGLSPRPDPPGAPRRRVGDARLAARENFLFPNFPTSCKRTWSPCLHNRRSLCNGSMQPYRLGRTPQ